MATHGLFDALGACACTIGGPRLRGKQVSIATWDRAANAARFLTYVLLAEIAGIFPKKTAALHDHYTMKLLEKLLTCSSGYSDRKILRALNSAEQIQKILERERTRAERSAGVLSLLAFGPAAGDSDRATLVRVVKILNGRLRTTDVMGWLDRERIVVVLPSTTAEGAWQMADNVCKSFPADRALPDCQVYSYPTDWPGEATSPTARRMRRSAAPPTACRNDDATPVLERRADGSAVHSAAAAVEALDRFVRRDLRRPGDFAAAAVAVALAVKLTSPGPVLFKQQRSGRGGKKFMMYKFRSMVVDAEAQKQRSAGAERAGRPGVQDQSRSARHAASAGSCARRASTSCRSFGT